MTIERVLVAVDFEPPSLEALRWISSYGFRQAELTAVHVIEPDPVPAFIRSAFPPPAGLTENARQGAEARLSSLCATAHVRPAARLVREGRPATEIAELAAEHRADLVVVGAPGHRRGVLNMLGSTAEQLVRTSESPVLLAHPLPAGPARRILAAVDTSTLAPRVIELAATFARANGGEIGIVYAVDPVTRYHVRRGMRSSGRDCVDDLLNERTHAWLAGVVAQTDLTDVRDVVQHVVIGDAAREIGALADREGYDLIVVGSRGAGGIGRTLLGSVASAVMRSADRPVAVIPQDADPESAPLAA